MTVQVRDFTEWQIDRIRVALNNYRISASRDGCQPSWATVRDSIIFSEPNIALYKKHPDNSFHPERLRRFALGNQRLNASKMRDIARFLVHVEALKLNELEEIEVDFSRFLALKDFLGTSSPQAQASIAALKAEYAAANQLANGVTHTFELRMMPAPSMCFVRVEETFRVDGISPEGESRFHRDDDVRPNIVRRGYGLPVTGRNLLHVFLLGDSAEQHLTYVQVAAAADISDDILLMRNDASVVDQVDSDGNVSFTNICHFTEGVRAARAGKKTLIEKRFKYEILPRMMRNKFDFDDELQFTLSESLPKAAKAFDIRTLRLALRINADINEQDAHGRTALHHAAALGARALVRLLVNSGRCNFLLRDNRGRTAAELAFEWSGDLAVALLLSKKQARQSSGRK